MGCGDKKLDADGLPVLIEFEADHLSDLDVPVVDRGAGIQRPKGPGTEYEFLTGLRSGEQGWHLESDEFLHRLAPVTGSTAM